MAGTGYVGLSLAVLLSQRHEVTAVDILPEKVEKINRWESPIQDEYIERYLAEAKAGKRTLRLKAVCIRPDTGDGSGVRFDNSPDAQNRPRVRSVSPYVGADYVIIAAPTNYDPQKRFL